MFNFFKPAGLSALTVHEAHERALKGEICLVDVREPNEWAQMRVPGAIHMPLSNLAKQASELPKEKPIVFYCLSGGRSARAIDVCRQLGLSHNMHVTGGITAWRAAGLPIER
jgi:rhodanese-related sulfurtransferase